MTRFNISATTKFHIHKSLHWEFVYGEDNVSRSNAYELGLPHQFFFEMYHFDFREKNFEIINIVY